MKKTILLFLILIVLAGCNPTPELKYIEPEPIPDIFNEYDGALEEERKVLEFEDYELEIGRTDTDINSVKTYTFSLPKYIQFELQGVDASSSIMEFKNADITIFSLYSYDYVLDDDKVKELYPDWNNYSFIGGHTNILRLNDILYEEELMLFEDSFKINNQLVF